MLQLLLWITFRELFVRFIVSFLINSCVYMCMRLNVLRKLIIIILFDKCLPFHTKKRKQLQFAWKKSLSKQSIWNLCLFYRKWRFIVGLLSCELFILCCIHIVFNFANFMYVSLPGFMDVRCVVGWFVWVSEFSIYS